MTLRFQNLIRYPLSAIRYPLSAIRYPLSAIRYPLSAIRYPLSAPDSKLIGMLFFYNSSLVMKNYHIRYPSANQKAPRFTAGPFLLQLQLQRLKRV
jgi:hypothetical protein